MLLLPYVDQKSLYEQYRFDEPWDGPHNRKLAAVTPAVYQCPSQVHHDGHSHRTSDFGLTNYAAIIGPGTAFDGSRVTALGDVVDGTSNTLLIVDLPGKTVPWTAPQDISVPDFAAILAESNKKSHQHEGGTNALLADGAVRFFVSNLKSETLQALTTIAGDDVVSEY